MFTKVLFSIWEEEENTRENIRRPTTQFQQSNHAIYNVHILALIQTELKEHKFKFIIFKNDLFSTVFELELAVFKGLLNTYTTLIIKDTWAF